MTTNEILLYFAGLYTGMFLMIAVHFVGEIVDSRRNRRLFQAALAKAEAGRATTAVTTVVAADNLSAAKGDA